MTSGGNRNPANPETGGWMDRMRRRRFTPTASFTHGRGTNPNGSRQVRAQCNSARVGQMSVRLFDALCSNAPEGADMTTIPAAAPAPAKRSSLAPGILTFVLGFVVGVGCLVVS